MRDFFIHNALYWLEEFHFDGLRIDAVHAIVDESQPDVLTELAQAVHDGPARTRAVHLVLENDRNEARRLARDAARRPAAIPRNGTTTSTTRCIMLVTGETDVYYADYADDPVGRIGRCLAEGFAYQGEASPYRGGSARGRAERRVAARGLREFPAEPRPGRQPRARRAPHSPGTGRAPCVQRWPCVLLAPSIPLLFMGEEFAADTPFLFFCDFGADLAARGARRTPRGVRRVDR